MKAFSLLVGARNKRRKFTLEDEKLLKKVTAKYFPSGFTILDASGVWFDGGNASLRREQARQLLVCTNQPKKLKPWSVEVGKVFGQKEVLLLELGKARRFQTGRQGARTKSHRSAQR
ncbi:MAG: DUF3574 domain-containing protein [Nibricoccus sp.]